MINLKGIVIEDFCNYKQPSMFLITSKCDFKCGKELCQNSTLALAASKAYSYESIYNAFISNSISKAIVLGGMEPFLQFEEILGLVQYFREHENYSPFVIYSGYNKDEILPQLAQLKPYRNIIVKYGRFIPNDESKFDEVLGITLVSKNQYAEVLA